MAVKSHIDILKEGRAAWNEWRAESVRDVPDLSYSELIDGNFNGFDFSRYNFRGINASKSDFSNTNLKDSDLNGTYLSFFGWPYILTSSLAICRGFVSSGNGLGLRLTALGSILPGRFPTFCCAIRMNRLVSCSSSLLSTPLCLQTIHNCSVCLKLSCRGSRSANKAD